MTRLRTPLAAVALVGALLCMTAVPASAHGSGHPRPPAATRLYTPPPDKGAAKQVVDLLRHRQWADAASIGKMLATPQAVWFTKGTPKQVRTSVESTMRSAKAQKAVPVLVAYNLPYRDCSQYSSGGAADTASYLAWIDGLAKGIGSGKAIVLLEPDGLGIIPWYTTINGAQEWCQPADADSATAAANRFEQLNGAVDRLAALPNVSVYLDGTHSAWLGVGDISDRLHRAGVERTDGFFLNVSNYEVTERQVKFASWISQCLWYGTNTAEGGWRVGHFDYCASQYYPADPNDFGTWGLTDQWYVDNVTNGPNPPSGPEVLAAAVIDTSRNGQGPWTPPADHPAGDPQVWCNPPDRGLGLRPTTSTGESYVDAYLWVKIPGESDGQCTRWADPAAGIDPVRGTADPAAGDWFPQMALELVRNANPRL
ncbi:glycoside hydrolase family 6 protein [Cellulomonas composti]|uniref:Glucanase n=1 Tax=Cellulomonas composti TaxID=266130 RepID=A0A511JA33_9CELL|nr:glycoside hydrolase family 6 protein [Cellulomonas composti]GEL94850.1 glucanase [Cellulomonas composti]